MYREIQLHSLVCPHIAVSNHWLQLFELLITFDESHLILIIEVYL